MFRIIARVVPSRSVDAKRLGWLQGKRAETRRNFPANFQYVDLRGHSIDGLRATILEEEEAFRYLESHDFSQSAIDEVDRRHAIHSQVPVVDFGVGAAVVALSALGCIPISSCRGPTLGRTPHSQPAPMVVFYARASHLAALIEAVTAADCQIVNNDAKVEIYADNVRKMHKFSREILGILTLRGGATRQDVGNG